MHVVQMRDTEHAREQHADEAALFVRVHGIVPIAHRATKRGDGQRQVERNLRRRRTNPHVADERRTRAAEDPQPRHRDVAAEGIRDEIDRMAQLEQRANTVILAERRAPGLEERLRGDHQDAHREEHHILEDPMRRVNVSDVLSRICETALLANRGAPCYTSGCFRLSGRGTPRFFEE